MICSTVAVHQEINSSLCVVDWIGVNHRRLLFGCTFRLPLPCFLVVRRRCSVVTFPPAECHWAQTWRVLKHTERTHELCLVVELAISLNSPNCCCARVRPTVVVLVVRLSAVDHPQPQGFMHSSVPASAAAVQRSARSGLHRSLHGL